MNLAGLRIRVSPRGLVTIGLVAVILNTRLLADDSAQFDNNLDLIEGVNNLRHHEHQAYGGLQGRLGFNWYGVQPFAQVAASGRGTDYVGAGLLYSFKLPDQLLITIASGPGWYRHQTGDPNLGSAVEFTSWIEFSGVILHRRVGIDIAHVSNAHLSRINPGTEGVGLSIQLWKR